MSAATETEVSLAEVLEGLKAGSLLPYLGTELARREAANADLPLGNDALIARLGKKVPIPGRLRKNLTAAAQYIETFRHRKILRAAMCDAFAFPAVPTDLHCWLAALKPPLIVDMAYEGASAQAIKAELADASWGQVQGISRAESRAGQGEDWVKYYAANGEPCQASEAAQWTTLLYKPLGSIAPAGNFLVSDADFVEVLTEIDIQTPIPDAVKTRRSGRGFVFIGCRFNTQLARTYARQIIKRSAGPHYALIGADEAALTRNEIQFLEAEGIQVLTATVDELLRLAG